MEFCLIDNISYYCNAEALGLVSGTVNGAFTEYTTSIVASKNNKYELEVGFGGFIKFWKLYL